MSVTDVTTGSKLEKNALILSLPVVRVDTWSLVERLRLRRKDQTEEAAMSDDLDQEFEKADMVLADALVGFQSQGVSQYVYGMALLEIGVAALVKLEEDEDTIQQVVREFIQKARSLQETAIPAPRGQ